MAIIHIISRYTKNYNLVPGGLPSNYVGNDSPTMYHGTSAHYNAGHGEVINTIGCKCTFLGHISTNGGSTDVLSYLKDTARRLNFISGDYSGYNYYHNQYNTNLLFWYNAVNGSTIRTQSYKQTRITGYFGANSICHLYKVIINYTGAEYYYMSGYASPYERKIYINDATGECYNYEYRYLDIEQNYQNLYSLSVANIDPVGTAQSRKNTADIYWNAIRNYGSSYPMYNQAQSKYNSLVAALQNNIDRDTSYNNLITISTPTNSTVQATAKEAKDNATTHWNTITAKTTSEWSNYNTAKAKYDAIVAGHAATVTRDTRLTKKADKTELNTSNSKLTFNQTVVHSKGISDYNSINSTLSSVNNKLK